MNRLLIGALALTAFVSGSASASPLSDAPRCEGTQLTIYFAEGETEISAAANAALIAKATRLSGCPVTGVIASAVSSDGETLEDKAYLSAKRTHAVLDALKDIGIAAERTIVPFEETTLAKDSDHIVPMARRVEIGFILDPARLST